MRVSIWNNKVRTKYKCTGKVSPHNKNIQVTLNILAQGTDVESMNVKTFSQSVLDVQIPQEMTTKEMGHVRLVRSKLFNVDGMLPHLATLYLPLMTRREYVGSILSPKSSGIKHSPSN